MVSQSLREGINYVLEKELSMKEIRVLGALMALQQEGLPATQQAVVEKINNHRQYVSIIIELLRHKGLVKPKMVKPGERDVYVLAE